MLAHLALAFSVIAQPPAPPDTREADAKEAVHLKNIRQVTSGFARAGEGYFRRDGRAIIFQAVPNPPPGVFAVPRANQDDYQIFTADLKDGAVPVQVSNGRGKCTCADFRPDGKGILFASTELHPGLASDAKTAPRGPAYSRTERYRWDFDPNMDIIRADADGKNPVRLTETPGYDAEGSYSPDGRSIVFTSFRDGDAEIYVMDADGKNPRRITHARGYDGLPVFSPDGKKLMWTTSGRTPDKKSQLFLADFDLGGTSTASR